MCEIIQSLIDEERAEERAEARKRHFIYVVGLVNEGLITIEQAIEHESDKDTFIQWLREEGENILKLKKCGGEQNV